MRFILLRIGETQTSKERRDDMAARKYFDNRSNCVIDRKLFKFAIKKGKEAISNAEDENQSMVQTHRLISAIYLMMYYAVFHEDDSDCIKFLAPEYDEVYSYNKMDIDDKAALYDGQGNSGSLGGAPKGNTNAAKNKDAKTAEKQKSFGENDNMQDIQITLDDIV